MESSVNDICAISHEALEFVEKFQIKAKVWSNNLLLKLNLNVKRVDDKVKKINLLSKLK